MGRAVGAGLRQELRLALLENCGQQGGEASIAYGRITMVPRTGPLSASSALVIRSWYQRGKSSVWGVSTGVLGMARMVEAGLRRVRGFIGGGRTTVERKHWPTTSGRHDGCGVLWHTGGVRAHCTGADEPLVYVTALTLG